MKIAIDVTAAEVVEMVTALCEGLVELVDEYRDDCDCCMDDDFDEFDSDEDDDEDETTNEEDHKGKVMTFSAKDGSDKCVTTAVSEIVKYISEVMNNPENDKLIGKE